MVSLETCCAFSITTKQNGVRMLPVMLHVWGGGGGGGISCFATSAQVHLLNFLMTPLPLIHYIIVRVSNNFDNEIQQLTHSGGHTPKRRGREEIIHNIN